VVGANKEKVKNEALFDKHPENGLIGNKDKPLSSPTRFNQMNEISTDMENIFVTLERVGEELNNLDFNTLTQADKGTLKAYVYQVIIPATKKALHGRAFHEHERASITKERIFEIVEEVLEEEKEKNLWAICTSSVGREDKEKYERCVKSIKKQNKEEKTKQ